MNTWYVLAALVAIALLALTMVFTRRAGAGGDEVRQGSAGAPATANEARAPTDADVQAFLEPVREALEATRRPVARIALSPMAEDDVRVSKVGGRPYWPRGEPYPSAADGRPLVLLAQIRLEELPSLLPGYPAHGLLQFFIHGGDDLYGMNLEPGDDLTAQKNFRVVHWPSVDRETEEIALPPASDGLPHDPRTPRRMRFVVGSETLSPHDHRYERLFGGDSYAAMTAFAASRQLDPEIFAEAVAERSAATGHKLGGYPYFTQEDPRRDDGFELLLQLDTDDAMMWGDMGVGAFFIAPSDLARADFSRVMYSWDCC